MHPPDEMMVDEFLPSVRLLTAKELRNQGSSQGRIAAALGVTQASVSLYLASAPGRAYSSLEAFHISKEDADRYVTLLAEDAMRNPSYAVETLGRIWTNLIGRGLACDAHRAEHPSLADCDYCIRAFGAQGERGGEAIAEVSRAVKAIESSVTFVAAMPEVSVNLACISGDSNLAENVVAVPGRIVKVGNYARSMRQPEFGASGHMSRMLLLVRTRMKDCRALVNLRYDGRMAKVLKKLGLRSLEIGDYSEVEGGDPTIEALRKRLGETRSLFDAIVDRGGKGIEPNVYFLGRDAMEAARLAIRASEVYSAA
jgi:predicted fused transcriptional regulator/phosphomethylpyrimidine kinase/predicted transcriptional regulator